MRLMSDIKKKRGWFRRSTEGHGKIHYYKANHDYAICNGISRFGHNIVKFVGEISIHDENFCYTCYHSFTKKGGEGEKFQAKLDKKNNAITKYHGSAKGFWEDLRKI